MKAEEELKPIYTSKYKITETGQVLKRTKDELKDEMKDKISMALKDPVLQQGFEIICKNLAELEKENAELKSKNCWKTCEYAESKSQWISQHIQDVEQLTKAKELFNEFLRLHYRPIVDEFTLFHKVEQFLRDSDIDGAIQQANEGLNFDRIADEMEQDLKDREVEK